MPYVPPADLDRRPVAVLGAGTLGRRVALMWSLQGGSVRLYDPDPAQRSAATTWVAAQQPDLVRRMGGRPGPVEAVAAVAQACADAWMVVEAVPERLQLKRQVFAELDRVAPADAVLASNSSSYASREFADVVADRSRVLNTHYYMPPERNAVELMTCGDTDEAVLALLESRAPAHGLVPFRVRRESTGFIYNRVWAAIKRECLAVVAEGVSTPEELDAIYQLSSGAEVPPFRRMDRVGLDVVLDIEEHYAAVRAGVPEGPRELLREYIARGWLGVKTGRGFYVYDEAGVVEGGDGEGVD